MLLSPFYLFLLYLVSGCFTSNDSKFIPLSSIRVLTDENIIKLAKQDLLAMLRGGDNQFKIDNKADAELFFAIFLLRHFEINDKAEFKEEMDKLVKEFNHIESLADLLNFKISQNGELISLESYFRSNQIIFFIDDLCPEVASIVKRLEHNLGYFYPSEYFYLLNFMKPRMEYRHMNLKNLKKILREFLDLIFQKPIDRYWTIGSFKKFAKEEQEVLTSTIFAIWGESIACNDFKAEKIHDLGYSFAELQFFNLIKEDCDITKVEINSAIRKSFGHKIFLNDLTLIDYMQKLGVFFTFANHFEHNDLKRFYNLFARNRKVKTFFENLYLLRDSSSINLLGKILLRYFLDPEPQLKEDIGIFKQLPVRDFTLLRDWEKSTLNDCKDFPSIIENFMIEREKKSDELDLESIHYFLLELSMGQSKRASKIIVNLIFDDIFFDKDLVEAFQIQPPNIRNSIKEKFNQREFGYRTLVLSKNLKDLFIKRAQYFDRIGKDKMEISFEKRAKRVFMLISDYTSTNTYSPMLLGIFTKAAVGKPISESQLNSIMTFEGDKSGPFRYLLEETNIEKVKKYLKELKYDPEDYAYKIVADNFIQTLVKDCDSSFWNIRKNKQIDNVNPRTKNAIISIWYFLNLPSKYKKNSDRTFLLKSLSVAQREFICSKNGSERSKNHLKHFIKFLKIRAVKYFGSEAARFGKFIDSLHLISPWEEDITAFSIFNTCFGIKESLVKLRIEYKMVEISEWQEFFSGYKNNFANPKASPQDLDLDIKELRYTHFELELGKFLVKFMVQETYSESTVIKEYQALRNRIKPEIQIDTDLEMILEKHGILYAFATCKGNEFITRLTKIVGIVAQRTHPANIAERFARYLENLEYLKWAIQKDNTVLFNNLHNCLVSSYLKRRPVIQDDIQLISQLSPQNRSDLGFWEYHLIGANNGLGNFNVQDPYSIKEALAGLEAGTNSFLGKLMKNLI
jgi:hypothetical protein